MNGLEHNVPTALRFRAMTEPVVIPASEALLCYLDAYADREFASDGSVIYEQPATPLPELPEHARFVNTHEGDSR